MKNQAKLVEAIKGAFKDVPLKQIQSDLADLIDSNPMTIYNKLSLRSQFTLDEVVTIANHYKLSLDDMLLDDGTDTYTFHSPGINSNISSYHTYVDWLYATQQQFLNLSRNGWTTFIMNQPSLFHLAAYPHLFYLKLYTYNMIKWKNAKLFKYDPSDFINSHQVLKKLEEINSVYQTLPRTEIVCGSYVDSIIDQYNYLSNSGYISDPYVKRKLNDDIHSFIDYQEDILSKNQNREHLKVYINRFIRVSNIILIESEIGGLLTLQADVPDVLISRDATIASHIGNWAQNVLDVSVLISSSGSIERYQWIERMRSYVDQHIQQTA